MAKSWINIPQQIRKDLDSENIYQQLSWIFMSLWVIENIANTFSGINESIWLVQSTVQPWLRTVWIDPKKLTNTQNISPSVFWLAWVIFWSIWDMKNASDKKTVESISTNFHQVWKVPTKKWIWNIFKDKTWKFAAIYSINWKPKNLISWKNYNENSLHEAIKIVTEDVLENNRLLFPKPNSENAWKLTLQTMSSIWLIIWSEVGLWKLTEYESLIAIWYQKSAELIELLSWEYNEYIDWESIIIAATICWLTYATKKIYATLDQKWKEIDQTISQNLPKDFFYGKDWLKIFKDGIDQVIKKFWSKLSSKVIKWLWSIWWMLVDKITPDTLKGWISSIFKPKKKE